MVIAATDKENLKEVYKLLIYKRNRFTRKAY